MKRWCIEVKAFGVWDTVDMADSFTDAITLASSLCEFVHENNIRISTPDHRLL